MHSLKCAMVVTNFNNVMHTQNLVESLAAARADRDNPLVIVDNASGSEDLSQLAKIDARYPWVQVIYSPTNIGYFPGLNLGIAALESAQYYDCIIVGNNDLLVASDFFDTINAAAPTIVQHYVLSPRIVTLDGHDQNPHVRHKISAFRRSIWAVYYTSFFLSRVVLRAARLAGGKGKRKDTKVAQEPGEMTLGYGACYLLTRRYLDTCKQLFMPTFLMHEEYFLSYQLSQHGARPFYDPSIAVRHVEHATVEKVPKRRMWMFEKASYKALRKLEGRARLIS